MSWLTNLSKLIDHAYSSKKLGALGETFMRAADDNPNYFLLPGPMTGDVPSLAQKHNLPLVQSTIQGYRPRDFVGVRDADGPSHSIYTSPIDQLGPYLDRRGKNFFSREGEEFKQLKDLYEFGSLSPDTHLYSIDSMGADEGKGVGKKGYAALYEYILAHPDAANLSSTLSNNNMKRRSVNMVGALEKWGDRAGDRLIVNRDQLGLTQDPSRALDYAALPTTAKIGLLNGHVAANTGLAVQDAARLMQGSLAQSYGAPLNWQERADRLGLKPDWEPSLDVPESHWDDLSGLLREVGATAPGRDSLRRTAIVAQQLKGPGLKPLDLSDRPDLTTGLARRRGGRV